MFGNAVELQCLNVREGLRFHESRNCLQGGSRTRADDDVCPTQLSSGPVGEGDLDDPWSYEPSGTQDELRPRILVVFQIHCVQSAYHPAFAFADTRHINGEAVVGDAKFFGSTKEGRDLRTVNYVLAWQAGDVRA